MNILEAIKLVDIAWEEGFLIAGINPSISNGYVSFRNNVISTLREKEIIIF